MGQEIERKFLTCNEAWRSLGEGVLYRQGYLRSEAGHQVNVQTVVTPGRTSGFIQIISHAFPDAIEFLIPIAEAIDLLDQLCVNVRTWSAQGVQYRSGFLSTLEGHTLRFRIAGQMGIFTVKTKTVGLSRTEFEFEIPIDQAGQLLDQICEQPQIEKYRYKIPYAGLIWEVDDFLGLNQGLVIAEVELESESQAVTLPDWIGDEVSGDRRYYNSYLVKNPFQTWGEK